MIITYYIAKILVDVIKLNVSWFMLSKFEINTFFLNKLPQFIITTSIQVTIIYWMSNLFAQADVFFICLAILILVKKKMINDYY